MSKRGAAVQINNLMSEDQLEALAEGEEMGTWQKASDVRGRPLSLCHRHRAPALNVPAPAHCAATLRLRMSAGCARTAQN